MNNYILLLLLLLSGCTHKKIMLKADQLEPREEDSAQALEFFEEGERLLFNDNKEALLNFKKALKNNPHFIAAYYNAGLALEALGDDKEAQYYYERCLELNKNQQKCLENLVLIKHRLNDESGALSLLERYKSHYLAHANYAFVKDDLVQAEHYARLALENDAENVEALHVMARIFYKRKSFAAAKWALKNALDYAPSHGGLYLSLGHVNKDLGLLDESLDAYALAAKYLPREEALQSYGLMLLRMGHIDQSIQVLTKVISQWPSDYRHYLHLGNAYLGQKNPQEAYKYYMQAHKINPNDKDILFNIGILLLDNKLEDISNLDRYIKSQEYFKSYVDQKNLSTDRISEVNKYLEMLETKIEIERSKAIPEVELEPEKPEL
jgi:tetratricopeptide (TPR) repeat protein